MKSFLTVAMVVTMASGAMAQTDFKPTAQDKFVPAGAKPELVFSDGEFTEGPVLAADGAILFSDIGNRILRFDPKIGQTGVFREPSGRAN
jgi:sugar lactone lactonase YvrE